VVIESLALIVAEPEPESEPESDPAWVGSTFSPSSPPGHPVAAHNPNESETKECRTMPVEA
jgi:hypothetical protein